MPPLCRAVLVLFLCAPALYAQRAVDGFTPRIFRSKNGQTMPYRFFIPTEYDKQQKYPLIIWLHGSGSVGTDNVKQISSASRLGTHIWTEPKTQARHPAFVLAPQSRGAWAGDPNSDDLSRSLKIVIEILDAIQKEFSIDRQRIYVAGQSMGGYGTWDLIVKRPDLFAAAVPLCGGGNPARAGRVAKIPIWAFHGDSDPTVSVYESRKMITAIKAAGGKPRYSEYKGVGHDVWERAFKEPELIDWLFAQHR